MVTIIENTLTFDGVNDLKDYISQNGQDSLSGKTIVLNPDLNAVTSSDNTYSLNDLLPAGGIFSSPVNIVVGSGATLTDDWSKVYSNPMDSSKECPNISNITLDAGAVLRAGYATAYPINGVFSKTGIYFTDNVDVNHPAYVEGVYYPASGSLGYGSLGSKRLLFHTKDQGLIGYKNEFYDANSSAVQFRVVNEDGSHVSDSDYNKVELTVSNNGSSTKYNTLMSGSSVVPTYIFDEDIGNAFSINKLTNKQKNDTFFNNNDDSYTCFLEGTDIKTVNGWVKVEDIKVNDQIITYIDGQEIVKSVVWVGRSLLNYKNNEIIQIKENTFENGFPSKDLYVTPEHCLFINNYFVPARMLVNHRNICQQVINNKFIYHIQLENHSVINAHGLMTESFLNTQNHTRVMDGHGVLIQNQTWEKDAAFPLNVQREFVEEIYKNLENRAIKLGIKKITKSIELTKHTDIHFVNECNEEILFTTKNGKYVLYVQPDVTTITIKSNSSKPSDVIGPFVDDRRQLGVQIGNIFHITKEGCKEINISDDTYDWYLSDHGKWTNGKSEFAINSTQEKSIIVVDLLAQNEAYIV